MESQDKRAMTAENTGTSELELAQHEPRDDKGLRRAAMVGLKPLCCNRLRRFGIVKLVPFGAETVARRLPSFQKFGGRGTR
jgi:hypothetical protein